MTRLVKRLEGALRERSKTPWASFEVTEFHDDGRVKIGFNWNTAFLKKIQSLGFHAETPEDSVQLFFFASQMRPDVMGDPSEENVRPGAHPGLGL